MYEHNTEILENEIARYREDDHFGPLNWYFRKGSDINA
jgi:hypothetical protein